MRLLNRKTRNDYRKLYEIELNNRRLYEDRYKQIYEQSIKYQKEIKEKNRQLTNLRIDLIDSQAYLQQEKECSNALRKERTQLRKMITQLGGDWKNGK